MTNPRGAYSWRLVRCALAATAALLAVPGIAQAADTYIVQLKDEPLASYTGGISARCRMPGTCPRR
jgi:hypothetical protein